MRPLRLALILGLITWSTGCGDKNPTRPTGQAPALTSLAITGDDAVLTGVSASYSVTATLTDGTTRTVTPTWTSSNPGVASVDTAGRLDGRTHGSTNLMASYEGRSASKSVQVINNYGGTWVGRYVIRACADTGELTDHDGGWCQSGPGHVGTVDGIRLTLVQGGKNLSEITGTVGSFRETITGLVTADGRLNVGGTLTERDFDYREVTIAILELGSWETSLDSTGGMTGRWAQDLTFLTGRRGTAHTENEVVTMSRFSSNVLPASAIR
jgi:hypothetical protein